MNASLFIYRAAVKPIIRLKTDEEKIAYFIDLCASKNGVTPEQIKKRGRKREVANARHMARYFIYHYTSLSYLSTAYKTSGVNHTTVRTSLIVLSDLCQTDRQFKNTFDLINKEIASQFSPVEKRTYTK